MIRQWLLYLLLVFAAVKCWHPTGHFLTAVIAKKEIEKKDPTLVPYLESILKVLSVFTKEKGQCFIEEAEFPDDIKYLEWKSFDAWHFNDNYIYKPDAPNKNLPKNPENIVWAINQCRATLRNKKTSEVNVFFGKSFMLRYLVHLIGDIHQPLHNTSIVSKMFPMGDAGGNNFSIKYPGVYDLHTFWDLCLKQYPEVRSPLTEDHLKFLDDTSEEIMSEFTRDKLKKELAKEFIIEWSDESQKLAEEIVYDGIEIGGEPTEEYIKRGFQIVKQQLALGGYRLSDTLLDIFKDKNDRPPVNFKLVAIELEAYEAQTAHKIQADQD